MTVDDRESKMVIEDGKSKVEAEEINPQSSNIKEPSSTVKHPSSKKKRPGKARGRGKKYQEAVKLVDRTQKYSLEEAIKLAKQVSYSTFPGTLEAHINTSTKNIRGLVSLPHLSGRSLTILAFGPSTSLRVNKDAPEFEGIIWGSEETIANIEKGPSAHSTDAQGRTEPGRSTASSGLKFDVLVTTPEWMPKLAKVAKILGPRGLMPNPKNGTITENLEKTITDLKGGKIEYKSEPNGQVIHLTIGKTTQDVEEIAANIRVLYGVIGKSKVKKITLSPTMGPGVKIDLKSI